MELLLYCKKFRNEIINLYLTNNISEHLNKIINSKLKSKYPIFINWRDSLLKSEEEINLSVGEIHKKDYSSLLLIYFINFLKNNYDNVDLLEYKEILKLNSLLLPGEC